jgi:hypothetical protein
MPYRPRRFIHANHHQRLVEPGFLPENRVINHLYQVASPAMYENCQIDQKTLLYMLVLANPPPFDTLGSISFPHSHLEAFLPRVQEMGGTQAPFSLLFQRPCFIPLLIRQAHVIKTREAAANLSRPIFFFFRLHKLLPVQNPNKTSKHPFDDDRKQVPTK